MTVIYPVTSLVPMYPPPVSEKCSELRRLLRLATTVFAAFSSLAFAAVVPEVPAVSATNPDYVLAINDTVVVTVVGEPDLAVTQLIDRAGSIHLSLVGDLKVANLAVRAAVALIVAAYKEGEFLRAPEVSVNVVEYAPRFATVMGAVRNAGKVTFPRALLQMEILDAITQCGGLTPAAKGEAVVVTRPQPNGTDLTFTIDVANLISGKKKDEKSANFVVLPGDRLFVPEHLF